MYLKYFWETLFIRLTETEDILIKRIDYKSNDEEFEETIFDYRVIRSIVV